MDASSTPRTSHSHYREICASCGTVYSQCRCTSPVKTEKLGLCPACRNLGVTLPSDLQTPVTIAAEQIERLFEAVKRKPSFPNPVDEYRPTDVNLWEAVLEVASGKRLEYRRGERTIHAPNGNRGYEGMPNNPYGIAWAVKQYNGFGASWKGKKEALWGGLLRMAAGGVEVTRGTPFEAAQALNDGCIQLASQTEQHCYWDITPKGQRVVKARLTEDLVKKVEALLRDYKAEDAKALGEWIESAFRINSPQTPKGGKEVKGLMQRMVWVLKNRLSHGGDPSSVAAEVKADWEALRPRLNLLTQFTDEGGVVVPKEIEVEGVLYTNDAGLSEELLTKYTQRLATVFKTITGWRKKALSGKLKVALKSPRDFNGTVTGKYHRASDTLWIRTTPTVLKRGTGYASFEYIIVHELGHRYEKLYSVPNFEKLEWWTSKYSRQEGEAFAELFALSNSSLSGPWDPKILERFEQVMTGREKVATPTALGKPSDTWAD